MWYWETQLPLWSGWVHYFIFLTLLCHHVITASFSSSSYHTLTDTVVSVQCTILLSGIWVLLSIQWVLCSYFSKGFCCHWHVLCVCCADEIWWDRRCDREASPAVWSAKVHTAKDTGEQGSLYQFTILLMTNFMLIWLIKNPGGEKFGDYKWHYDGAAIYNQCAASDLLE